MRIKLYVTAHHARASRTQQALKLAFGFNQQGCDRILETFGTWIVCTAEQFATFIIERNAIGGHNSIKELKAQFIDQPHNVIDVSNRGSN